MKEDQRPFSPLEEDPSLQNEGPLECEMLEPGALFGNMQALGGSKAQLSYCVAVDSKRVELLELDT